MIFKNCQSLEIDIFEEKNGDIDFVYISIQLVTVIYQWFSNVHDNYVSNFCADNGNIKYTLSICLAKNRALS